MIIGKIDTNKVEIVITVSRFEWLVHKSIYEEDHDDEEEQEEQEDQEDEENEDEEEEEEEDYEKTFTIIS
ncbi:hypothetical protein HZH68_015978 [Vespula germanica]|uniref:Uncharacterized protein n=1 Tax=Vespula germanica TaxID=30212 RepID=A0A834J303_VESGE|nr:hypothetical protein HZH68_015978 [Vespula germanica]